RRLAPSAETVPVGRHDQQGVAFGQASASTTRGDYHAFNLIGCQILARAAGLIALADWRKIVLLCPFRCLGKGDYSGHFLGSFDGLAGPHCPRCTFWA